MKAPVRRVAVAISLASLQIGLTASHAAARRPTTLSSSCRPTGIVVDGINLTTRLMNPADTVSGDVDANGCNIGIYYGVSVKGKIRQADIHGSNYYGILNAGGQVSITGSSIHDIGDSPFDGEAHGTGIRFAATPSNGATGSIVGSTIYRYQLNGIVVSGPKTSVQVDSNSIIGLGPVKSEMQSGITVQNGARGSIDSNYVAGDAYTGSTPFIGTGITVEGGCGAHLTTRVKVTHNLLTANDVGVWLSNANAGCTAAPSVPTNDVASYNIVIDDGVTNTSGCAIASGCSACGKVKASCAYQAGIGDTGNSDRVIANRIIGVGYTPAPAPPPVLLCIDTSVENAAIKLTEKHNACPK